ncbi:TniQ family protein [Chryseobacterium rhizoplanae]|uniref:TniQ family protein n=1 Tax=Chryseobacterium rhizoplanae TaxID=1609531 RepID=UPI001CE30660|nr:TniQ family protein [Chryseobacterium rhizoplanae]UCA58626.1 TniQ family protein [Chryseobacterium rhizoplanae]
MPYIQSLGKNIWAKYIPPYQDELFTSWFFRITQAHEVKSHSFGKYYFKDQQFWNRDVDNMPTDYLKKVIYDNTPLEYSTIDRLFLNNYQNWLFENHNPNGFTSGILPLGITHRKRKRNGLLYCPTCLKQAYYKKQWRLLISYVCCDCEVLLRDCCPKCYNPITFHRLEQGNKKIIKIQSLLHLCSLCNYDLTQYFEKANKNQISTQIKIYEILNQGYSENIQYSFSYFYLLQNIMILLSRKHPVWGRLRKACEFEFGALPQINQNFTMWPIESRMPIFGIACKIINDYSFLKYLIVRYNLRLSEFSKDHILPYSFENIFKRL